MLQNDLFNENLFDKPRTNRHFKETRSSIHDWVIHQGLRGCQ